MRDSSAIQITVEAYPRLAAIFKCDASSVEHAMRSAIEATWTRGSLSAIHAYFGNTIDSMRGKPSNAEFVQRIASQVRIKPTRSFLDMLR